MSSSPETAAEITRSSKSNLALAFVSLPKERREDMKVFYAFCRLVDDVADSETLGVEEKQRGLDLWRRSLLGPEPDEPAIAGAVREIMDKYRLPAELMEEIISGVEMDLHVVRYESFEDLRKYCYRVASAVGLVSIEIFGYTDERCKEYAVALGIALQLTNIMRDVGKDLDNGGRIYLPMEDLERHGYSEEQLRGRQYNKAFVELMEFEAERAESYYAEALRHLPPRDRHSMVAAEIMRTIYWRVLRQMRRDRFRVFERSYGLSKAGKLLAIAEVLARDFLRRSSSTE